MVDAFPVDESVYGVRGMAGNVQEWCCGPYNRGWPAVFENRVAAPELPGVVSDNPEVLQPRRGGHFVGTTIYSRCASRYASEPTYRIVTLGMRLVRSLHRR